MWFSAKYNLGLIDFSEAFVAFLEVYDSRETFFSDFDFSKVDNLPKDTFKVGVIGHPFSRTGFSDELQSEALKEKEIDFLVRLENIQNDLKVLYGIFSIPYKLSLKDGLTFQSLSELKHLKSILGGECKALNYPLEMSYSPEIFLNGTCRFDLAAKMIYARYHVDRLKTTWHLDLYKSHILTFNGGWEWPDGNKSSVEDFVRIFNNLLGSFDFEKAGIIPLSSDGNLANGAHRVVAAWISKKKIRAAITEGTPRPYGYRFFTERLSFPIPSETPRKNRELIAPLAQVYTDEMALEFCRQCPSLRIVILFPRAYDCFSRARSLLEYSGKIIYCQKYPISLHGLDFLVKELYRNEPWIGGFFSPHSMGKTEKCWDPSNPYLRVFLWEASFQYPIAETKKKIRDIFCAQNHSVHINDTPEETLRIGGLLFNRNSRYFLEHARPLSKINQKMFLGYSGGNDACITGSFVLALFGLRESRDLDYISSGPSKPGSHNPYAGLFSTTLDDIIYNPRNHFYFAGKKVATLQIIREMKQRRKEPKDFLDISLIDKFFGKTQQSFRPELKVKSGCPFDISQITFYKNGLRLENFCRNNHTLGGYVNFFEASDTTENLEKSVAEGLGTKVYDPTIPRFKNMVTGGYPGKIGCNLSHYYLYLHLLERSPCKWHLILEDDVDISGEDMFSSLSNLLSEIDSEETHYIKLITFEEFKKQQFRSINKLKVGGLYRKIFDWGTGAQLISNEGLRILLNNRPWDFIDNTINNLAKQLKCTCFRNEFFDHRGTESGVHDSSKKYYGSLIYGQQTERSLKNRLGFPSKQPKVSKWMHGWFDQNVGKAACQMFQKYKVRSLIELGSWYGKSSVFFASFLDKIYCVDLWNEKYIRDSPDIGFSNYEIFEEHPLYSTFLANTWHLRNKIIPVRDDTCEGIEKVSYLPFSPEAAFIDAEHTYKAVFRELNTLFEFFGYIPVVGNGHNPETVQAAEDFCKNVKAYQLSVKFGYFFLEPEPLRVRCRGFWNDFDPKKSYLAKLFPRMEFEEKDVDFLYQGDYAPYNPKDSEGKPVIAYSAESWFKSSIDYSLEITLRKSGGKNLQLRNYERIYFERFGDTNVYSNIPAYNLPKKKFCCFVVKNPNCKQRNTFFHMLNSKKKVDSLGFHLHNVPFTIPPRNPHTESHDDYLKILGEYRFCICFENTSQDGYLTEKLFNAMKAGTVPVYWGSLEAKEIFNPKSFIYIPTVSNEVGQTREFQKAIDRILYLEDHWKDYREMVNQPRINFVGKENHRVERTLQSIRTSIMKLCRS